ncbi:MAG: HEPN domain-containing protein [Myxococcales bacterium]|nr:HEPN domain-containing protein [Myxococcales bacterium]
MTANARQEAVTAELSLGRDALRAATALRDLGLVLDALSRLYFAAMHFSRALLAVDGIEVRSHRGLVSVLGLHFVKPGRLEPEYQQTLARLETWRDKADYERNFAADRSLLDREIESCLRLETRVVELVRDARLSA